MNPMLVLPWKEPLDVEWIIDQFTCDGMEEQETVNGRNITATLIQKANLTMSFTHSSTL